MAGLLDALGSYSGDDTTKDQYGQTQADRRQPLWSGLIKAGLLGVAAGGNLMPSERAKYIAEAGGAIGDIQPQMQAQQTNAMQNLLRQQQVQTSQVEMQGKQADLAQQAKWRAYADSPEFQQAMDAANASPAERAVAKDAAYKGDFKTVGTVLDPRRNDPKASGNFIVSHDANGKPIVMNASGRVILGPDGKPPTGAANDEFDATKPNVGGLDHFDQTALQGVPHDLAVQALKVARGEIAPPTTRSNPDAAEINRLAALVAGANGTSFQARQNFEKSLTSGDLNKSVIAPWSASMQHGQEAQEAFDDLANVEGGKYVKYLNMARNTWGSLDNPDVVRKIARFEKAMENYGKEAEKLIAGSGGQITDAVRAQVAPLTDPNKSPAQQIGLMQAMISQGHARLAQPIQNARTLRHDSTIDMNNIGLSPEGLKSYEWLNNRMKNGPGTANSGKPAATGGPTLAEGEKNLGQLPDGSFLIQKADGSQVKRTP